MPLHCDKRRRNVFLLYPTELPPLRAGGTRTRVLARDRCSFVKHSPCNGKLESSEAGRRTPLSAGRILRRLAPAWRVRRTGIRSRPRERVPCVRVAARPCAAAARSLRRLTTVSIRSARPSARHRCPAPRRPPTDRTPHR
ncbi:hypothetical protein [Lysobacter gummosus]|uniref:hypothetical protein n=1 Tax=Lysobacter gummosus TaxID=262324 RepID=UPI003629FF75